MTFVINFTETINEINSEETIIGKPKSYQPLPFHQLNDDTHSALVSITQKVHGDVDTSNWSVSSMFIGTSGFYEKAFHSALVLKDDVICIQYGKEFAPVDFNHADLTYSVSTFKFDQYDEASLIIYDDEADVSYPVPLRLNQETFDSLLVTNPIGVKSLNLQKVSACAIKKNWDKFKSFLKEGKTGGGSELVDIKELIPMMLYPVDSLREVAVTYNGKPAVSYILGLKDQDLVKEMWLPSNLKQSAELGKVVPGTTHIGYFLTEPNKEGKQYVKGFISQKSTTALPVTSQNKAKAIEASVTIEATAVEVDLGLPFTNRAGAIEWATTQLPSYSLEDITALLAEYKKTDFFNKVNELVNTPVKAVEVVDAEVELEAAPF